MTPLETLFQLQLEAASENDKGAEDALKWAQAEIGQLRADNEVQAEHIEQLDAEIKRLHAERDNFLEQLAIRSPTGLERDMQEIMRINNELKAEIERLRAALREVMRAGGGPTYEIARTALEGK